jgi:hypothetical protein
MVKILPQSLLSLRRDEMNITAAVEATVREYMHFWDDKQNPTLAQLSVAGQIPYMLEALGKSVYCKIYDGYSDDLEFKKVRDDIYLEAASANDYKELMHKTPDLYVKGHFRAMTENLETEFDVALDVVFGDEATGKGL